MVSRRVGSTRPGLALVLALAAVSACAPGPGEPLPLERALAWQRLEDGWVRAATLAAPVAIEGGRAGDVLEAVIVPEGPGELVVEARGGSERVAVDAAGRVEVPLPRGGRAAVRFEGAAAVLHGARIVPGAPRGGAGGPRRPPRRVALVVIDTLRADAVTPESMPELLELFAGGVRFRRAYSPATWTLPAMASVLTGRPPTELALPDGTLVALAADTPTVATALGAHGYHTVGISANYTVNHENGYSAGFELFLAPAVLAHGDWPDATWVLERARRALEWFPDRDLFLYLHLMDPHDPYRNHETGEVLSAPSTAAVPDPEEVARMRTAYASEARRAGRLLADFLRDAGPFERLVVTADHGEEFLEHGGFKHGPTVYPEVSRVPLLVQGGELAGASADAPLSLLGLRRYLAGEGPLDGGAALGPEVVTFVHAAPRFSAVSDRGQAILFGHDLGEAASETAGVTDPIGRWLREHHPALDFVDSEGAWRAPAPGEPWEVALRLAARFRGLGAGRWVLAPKGAGVDRLALEGAAGSGWWWGGAAEVSLATAGEGNVLSIRDPDPFVLAFVAAGPAGPVALVAGGDSPAEIDAPPTTPPERAVTWSDRGRPAAALAGVEETLQRLRNQGYL